MNFERSVIDVNSKNVYEQYFHNTIDVNADAVSSWFDKQPPAVRKLAASQQPEAFRDYTMYNFMIKPHLKPPLVRGAMLEYSSVQTIAYQPKSINVLFCPIFNQMRERFTAVIKSKFLIYSDMSPKEFETILNNRVDANLASFLNKIENDMAKYDKSQGAIFLLAECELYRKLGMPDFYVEIWYNSHRFSTLRDRIYGVTAYTEYQRKSGDASTFLGNTLVLMMVTLAVYDEKDIYFACFAGDDSLMIMNPSADLTYNRSNKFSDVFNLECKELRFEYSYFCSRFVLFAEGRIVVIPDILKVVTKLGRQDMVDEKHIEEYRVSFKDNLASLYDETIFRELSRAIQERYKTIVYDHSKVFRVLCTLAADPSLFKQLFYFDNDEKMKFKGSIRPSLKD